MSLLLLDNITLYLEKQFNIMYTQFQIKIKYIYSRVERQREPFSDYLREVVCRNGFSAIFPHGRLKFYKRTLALNKEAKKC